MKLLKKIRNCWRRITDTKPKFPKVGDRRIHEGKSQILFEVTYNSKDGFTEQWKDEMEFTLKWQDGQCPRCQAGASLNTFRETRIRAINHIDLRGMANPAVPPEKVLASVTKDKGPIDQ